MPYAHTHPHSHTFKLPCACIRNQFSKNNKGIIYNGRLCYISCGTHFTAEAVWTWSEAGAAEPCRPWRNASGFWQEHEHTAPADLIQTEISHSPSMQTCLTLLYIQSSYLLLCTTFNFHVCSGAGCSGNVRKQRVITLPTISVTFSVCVWQMGHMCGLWWQAGWSLRLEEASSGTEGGSEDSNTSSPINKSQLFHHTASPCVGRGLLHGRRRVHIIFGVCTEFERGGAEECVNGATAASFLSSEFKTEWEECWKLLNNTWIHVETVKGLF